MQSELRKEDSDSEDDSDYVPPAQGDISSEDDEPENKRARTCSPPPVEDAAEQKKTRDALWAEFQASVEKPLVRPTETVKTIKIVKRFRYAGEDVVEVKEVAENSDEAKKWPLWTPEDTMQETAGPSSSGGETNKTATSSEQVISPAIPPQTDPSTSKPKPAKRPGPRKPKVQLAPLPGSQKAKKLTTLDKSAMDWRAHVQGEGESDLKDELESNRRGGGYLEKQEFLQRVEQRKEEALEASKSVKRRRL
ncbi:hypothetical protein QCA50_013307 [Cerrena zonata]|uniref:SWR1-complex protein 5 n=1 Tax=Cerrena zonata TaxID=2478898 RepID=A0AAW0FQX5_9APHY